MDRGYGNKKRDHPKDRAGILSLATFAYMFPMLKKGKKETIDESDLTKVMKSIKSKKVGDELEKCWEINKTKKSKPSIIRAIISCHGIRLLNLWIAHMITKAIDVYFPPWALGKFVSYFEKGQTSVSSQKAIFYGMIMISITMFNGLWREHYYLWKEEVGFRMQSSISSLLYRKALTLNQAKIKNITSGNIITAITKDVHGIKHALLYGIDNVGDILQIGLICYLLYQKMGLSSLGGIVVIFLCIISQIGFAKFIYNKRGACNEKTDQRLKKTQEVLSSIRLVKMYAWESFFEKKLLWLRKIELKNLFVLLVMKSVGGLIGSISEKIAHISTLLIYLWLGNVLNADMVYYTTKLFQKVSRIMHFIPFGMQAFSECWITLNRIDLILNAEENEETMKDAVSTMKPEIIFVEAGVKIDESIILREINLKLKPGLNILIGPSGCGKTSLIKTILGEYSITDGKMKVQGRISYASQNPWLFPSSLRQNILFGETIDEYKYEKIINACGLTLDINMFANGDEVILTDCGANLSRGQQARINLARSLYKGSEIYLLDDSLASLDVNIKDFVFNNAIRKYLSDKLCLLVTHSIEFVEKADNVIIMGENTIKFSGSPKDIPSDLLKFKESNMSPKNVEGLQLNEIDKKNVEDEEGEIYNDENEELLTKKQAVGKSNIYEENKKDGKISFEVYKNYFKFGGGMVMFLAIISVHILCEASNGMAEKFMSKWLNAQKVVSLNNSTKEVINATYIERYELSSNFHTTTPIFENETFPQDFIKPKLKNNMDFFDFFIGATIIGTFFTLAGGLINFYFSMKVAKNIHKSIIRNLMRGCMNFFDTHLIGNVLTRCSKDIFMLDEFIPYLWRGIRMFFLLAVNLFLVASVNLWFALLSCSLGVIFYSISSYILTTSRNLQRLCCSTLSPMLGHLNSTLEGLATVRAHGIQQILRDEFDEYLDTYITAHHLQEITRKILGFYCHFIASLFTAFITIKLVYLPGILAGDAGLAMTQTNALSHHIEVAMFIWMYMENSMTSVERLLEYTNLPLENSTGRNLENWPQKGGIKFENVDLNYRSNSEPVLRNITFTIQPQEKIGIVGRTGAGKSSIIVTLFRMYNYTGDIKIDDVNIKTLSLKCLRSHLAIIPQDPLLFSGTIRSNIDPFNEITDEEIWKIMEVVNIKSLFSCLNEDVTDKNLSIGQKQLICIARALTKKCEIVILDEATANMDEETDRFIHDKIGELFKFCTVIIVAHRLNTVMNCDKILVMDKGEAIEFDSPKSLLNNTNSVFYKMVHHKQS